ncbi:MAG: 4-alpha-glucanotransferase [Sarcina sp.]
MGFFFYKAIWESNASLAITTIQDFLGLSSEGRMNTPSTTSGNWKWRVRKSDFTKELAKKIYEITKESGRIE